MKINSNAGASGQQCCYDADGNILEIPSPGAGTPDKVAGSGLNVLFHLWEDVVPFNDCCRDCEEPDIYCPKYTTEARGGDTSHCHE